MPKIWLQNGTRIDCCRSLLIGSAAGRIDGRRDTLESVVHQLHSDAIEVTFPAIPTPGNTIEALCE